MWSGASVGVSVSTQRRMLSRMVFASKRLEDVASIPSLLQFNPRAFSGARSEWPISELFRLLARRDLFDQLDNAASKLGIGNAGKRAGQCQPFRGCEKIRDIGGRTSLGKPS